MLDFTFDLAEKNRESSSWLCSPEEFLGENSDKCCEKSKGYELCKRYADDNELWLADFTKAIYKLTARKCRKVPETTMAPVTKSKSRGGKGDKEGREHRRSQKRKRRQRKRRKRR